MQVKSKIILYFSWILLALEVRAQPTPPLTAKQLEDSEFVSALARRFHVECSQDDLTKYLYVQSRNPLKDFHAFLAQLFNSNPTREDEREEIYSFFRTWASVEQRLFFSIYAPDASERMLVDLALDDDVMPADRVRAAKMLLTGLTVKALNTSQEIQFRVMARILKDMQENDVNAFAGALEEIWALMPGIRNKFGNKVPTHFESKLRALTLKSKDN